MDSKDFKALFNLILLILFIAAALLGPLIERMRKRKEAEKRRLEGKPEDEPEPPPGPAYDGGRPRLPYENVLEEVFGPYIERRRQAAREAAQAPPPEIVVVPEVDPDEEIRRVRMIRRPEPEPEVVAPAPEPEAPVQRLAEGAPAEVAHRRRERSLDEILFRNPRLGTGAKLLLAAEILANPRVRRGTRAQPFGRRG